MIPKMPDRNQVDAVEMEIADCALLSCTAVERNSAFEEKIRRYVRYQEERERLEEKEREEPGLF
jgi:hypothetical protein